MTAEQEDLSQSEKHAAFVAKATAAGWTAGETNLEAKTHTYLRPWTEMSDEDRNAYITHQRGIVADMGLNDDAAEEAAPGEDDANG